MERGMKSVGLPVAGLLSRSLSVSIRVQVVGHQDHEGHKWI